MTKSFFVRENSCPSCNYVMDMAGSVDGRPLIPEPGDLSVCIRCGELLRFARGMKLHKMTDFQIKQLRSENPKAFLNLLQAQFLVRITKSRRSDHRE